MTIGSQQDKQSKNVIKRLLLLTGQSNRNKCIIDNESNYRISKDKNLFAKFIQENLTKVMATNETMNQLLII